MTSPHNPKLAKPPRKPKISRHATGQGVVWLDGKNYYQGK